MLTARFPGVRLVVFDLDGTLIDSSGDLRSAANATLQTLAPQAPPLSADEVRAFVGDGARKLVARALEARGLPGSPDDALAVFLTAYRERMLDTTSLYPDVRGVLDALASGRQLAVLSNKPGEMCREILAQLGVAKRFATIWGGDDAPKKPDPAGLLQLMATLGVARQATLMVGDSANDVKTARAAGVLSVGVSYGFDPAGIRAESPDAVLSTLTELPPLLL